MEKFSTAVCKTAKQHYIIGKGRKRGFLSFQPKEESMMFDKDKDWAVSKANNGREEYQFFYTLEGALAWVSLQYPLRHRNFVEDYLRSFKQFTDADGVKYRLLKIQK